MLRRICGALAARLVVRVDWRGEALDQLLDADHARLVEMVVRELRAGGWHCLTEATFAIRGERGSVDVLAYHEGTGILLVVEVKSVIADAQATLATFDRKIRLGPEIARERGWRVRSVAAVMVLAEGRTNRRRVEALRATFDTHLPARSADMRTFLARPSGAIRGLWFLSGGPRADGRHRIGRPRAGSHG
ncbi:MAG: hypothetical protein L0227_07015 [Chloroflexi bacterium]|nr:hypothetical protein [Chloroflexota bacterium]